MNLFYCESLSGQKAMLNESESFHCSKVLRKKEGDLLHLFDGKGIIAKGLIQEVNKKSVHILLQEKETLAPDPYYLHIAVAPTKNNSRIEWLIEKAVEFGVHEISFFHSYHSERKKLGLNRIQKIILSAAKQSKTYYLPKVNEIRTLKELISQDFGDSEKFIATLHEKSEKYSPKKNHKQIVLVGPEGGFSEQEIEMTVQQNFRPVLLGHKRLRTETAALYFASSLYQIHS